MPDRPVGTVETRWVAPLATSMRTTWPSSAEATANSRPRESNLTAVGNDSPVATT